MRDLRRVVLILGGMGCLAAGAGAAAGCGDDTVALPIYDSGLDVTVDNYVPPPADAQPDVKTSDASDAGADVVQSDAGDASNAALLAFPTQVATAYCGRIQACCGGIVNPFNLSACVANNTAVGVNGELSGTAGGAQGPLGSGTVVYNPATAQACLNEINAIDCSPDGGNVITSAQWKQIVQDCTGAISGTLDAGASCISPIECAAGEFCDIPTGDGGPAGHCAPLRGDGGPCGNFGAQTDGVSEEACSYRRSGTSGLSCANEDNQGNPLDAAVWVCKPQSAAGGPCNYNVDCQTGLCDPGDAGQLYQCANSMPLLYPSTFECTFTTPDGG